jgi:hypothetical protein
MNNWYIEEIWTDTPGFEWENWPAQNTTLYGKTDEVTLERLHEKKVSTARGC